MLEDAEEILPVRALFHLACETAQLGCGDVAHPVGNFSSRRPSAPAALRWVDEVGRRISESGSRVSRRATGKLLAVNRPARVTCGCRRCLELAARRGLQRRRDLEHVVIVEVRRSPRTTLGSRLSSRLSARPPSRTRPRVASGNRHLVAEDRRPVWRAGRCAVSRRNAAVKDMSRRERHAIGRRIRRPDEDFARPSGWAARRTQPRPDSDPSRAAAGSVCCADRETRTSRTVGQHQRRQRVVDLVVW